MVFGEYLFLNCRFHKLSTALTTFINCRLKTHGVGRYIGNMYLRRYWPFYSLLICKYPNCNNYTVQAYVQKITRYKTNNATYWLQLLVCWINQTYKTVMNWELLTGTMLSAGHIQNFSCSIAYKFFIGIRKKLNKIHSLHRSTGLIFLYFWSLKIKRKTKNTCISLKKI